MTGEPVVVYFRFERRTDEQFFREVLLELLEAGFRTTFEGDTGDFTVTDFSGTLSEITGTLDVAAATLARSKHANVPLYYKDLRIELSKNEISEDEPEGPHISIHIWHTQFEVLREDDDKSESEQRVNQFISLVQMITDATNAELAYGNLDYLDSYDHPELKEDETWHPTSLYWINVYSPDIVQAVGQDLVDSAPWWGRVETDSGGRVLVSTTRPIEFGELNERAVKIAEHLDLTII